jgi:hypothetical protein
MLKRVNGFTGKLGSIGFDSKKSFPIDNPQVPQNEKNETQKAYPEKERKSKFQKK